MAASETPFAGQYPGLCISDLINGGDVDSDSVDAGPYYGFIALATGTVKFNTLAGRTRTLAVTAGVYYPIGVSRLWTTGHTTITAADIELAR